MTNVDAVPPEPFGGEEGDPPDQEFLDLVTGRASADGLEVELSQKAKSDTLHWVADLIRSNVPADENPETLRRLHVAADLETAARGYGTARVLPLALPAKRGLGRGEHQGQLDAANHRALIVLSVCAEYGSQIRTQSLSEFAQDNGFSERQWARWAAKVDPVLKRRSQELGRVATYGRVYSPIPPAFWDLYRRDVAALERRRPISRRAEQRPKGAGY